MGGSYGGFLSDLLSGFMSGLLSEIKPNPSLLGKSYIRRSESSATIISKRCGGPTTLKSKRRTL